VVMGDGRGEVEGVPEEGFMVAPKL
jgi:hypothetical protein